MRSMYQNLIKLYNGLNLIRSHYQKGTILNTMPKIPNYLIGSILRAGSVTENKSESINYDLIVNIGDENEPFYIVVFDNEWDTYVDAVMSPLKYNKNFVVTISSAMFKQNTDIMSIIPDLNYLFNQMVAYDREMDFAPSLELVYMIDKPEGYGIPSYDICITIAYVYLTNRLLKEWYRGTSTVVSEYFDYLRSMLKLEDETTKDDTMYLIDLILSKSCDDMEEVIKDGYFLQAIYT